MDTPVTQENALHEIIEAVVGTQTEFTNDGVKALVKTVFQIYEQEYLNSQVDEVVLTPDEELLNQFGIEILSSKFSRTQIDEQQLEFLLNYLPKLKEGQFAKLRNPKGISKLREELIEKLGKEDYKITSSYKIENSGKVSLLSIYKKKKKV